MPGGADDRYFSNTAGQRLGRLDERIDQHDVDGVSLSDRWLDLDVDVRADRPSGIWAFPVETVSQSEAGFELVHQSVCVMPHWVVVPDANGRWAVNLTVAAKCQASKTADSLVAPL